MKNKIKLVLSTQTTTASECNLGRGVVALLRRRYVPGRILMDNSLSSMRPEERAEVYTDMGRVLAALHVSEALWATNA